MNKWMAVSLVAMLMAAPVVVKAGESSDAAAKSAAEAAASLKSGHDALTNAEKEVEKATAAVKQAELICSRLISRMILKRSKRLESCWRTPRVL
jgi:hypothetical protein